MENENMMENNEVTEVTENYEESNSGLGWKVIGGALATAGAIWGGLKLRKILKAKKEEKTAEVEAVEGTVVEPENVEDEATEKTTNKKK